MSVSCEFFVFSGRGLCEGPVPPSEGSYRMCLCVTECTTVSLYSYNEYVNRGQAKKERK